MNLRQLSAVALSVGSLWSGAAMAQVSTWDFTDRAAPGSCTGTFGSNANTINCQTSPGGTTTTLQARAYSTTGSSGAYETAAVNDQTSSGFGAGNRIEGYTVTGAPNHAFDSSGGSFDALLMDFEGTSRILNSVTIGWSGADADFQVLRWTGATSASVGTVGGSILGKTAAQLASNGWELVSTVDGVGRNSSVDDVYNLSTVNSLSKTSSWWLITAFNSSLGGALSIGDDAFKIAGVTTKATTTTVSSPGTLALAGLGLFGAVLMRRRRA